MFLSKIVAYITLAKPILMPIKDGVSNIIKDAQVGAIEQPNDTEGAVNFLYHSGYSELIHIGENSRKYYRGNMSLEKSCKKLIEIVKMGKRKENSNV